MDCMLEDIRLDECILSFGNKLYNPPLKESKI